MINTEKENRKSDVEIKKLYCSSNEYNKYIIGVYRKD
jgi:hypothetical protein